ncbi:MAG TPA: hypothetical protein DCE52_02435 [Rhodobacteraceae bacterium]|nr:hypothetical protein [Paracoccaceae bacterium]
MNITNTTDGSSFDGGEGNDTFNVDDVDTYSVVGGAGDDEFTTAVALKATLFGGSGTDTLTIDGAGALTMDSTFLMNSIEELDLTAVNDVLTLDDESFASNKTMILIGNAAADTLKIVGDNTSGATIDGSGLTIKSGSTVTIQYLGGTKADTITGGVAAETFFHSLGADVIEGGATGTDTFSITDSTLTPTGSTNAATGVVINLGTTAIVGASVTAQTSKFTSGGISVAGGTLGYAYDANVATNSSTVQTLSDIEDIIGGDGVDYIVGSDTDNVINGNAGADYIDGGDGNDTITVDSSAESSSDKMHGGAGEDILSVVGTTTVTTTDASITGIETVTLAGTGDIDVILLGQTENFTINANTGSNEITGGQGDDTIALVVGGSDIVHFGAAATNGYDTITGFDTTEDHLNLDVVMTGVTNLVAITGHAASEGDTDFVDNEAYVYADGATASAGTGTATITDYTNLTQVADFLSDAQRDNTSGTSNDTADGDEAMFVINDLVGDKTYVYHFEEDGVAGDASSATDTISATELKLLAVVTEESGGALVAADIV